MCKAIQDMIMDGREEGLQEGIQIFILDNMEENIPRERIYEKLQRRFGLTSQIAEQYMEAYYMA